MYSTTTLIDLLSVRNNKSTKKSSPSNEPTPSQPTETQDTKSSSSVSSTGTFKRKHAKIIRSPNFSPDGVEHQILSIPENSEELLRGLNFLLSQKPPATFVQLVQFHNNYPEVQSTKSYNLLLQHAIRHHYRRQVLTLSHQFKLSSLTPDWDTYKLWIRFHVREDRWHHAWESLMFEISRGLGEPPLDVWTEFLGTPRHIALNRRRRESQPQPFPVTPDMDVLKCHDLKARVEYLIQNAPESESVLRFFRLVVARLVQTGRIQAANEIIQQLLAGTTKISPKINHILLSIIHQTLAFSPIGIKTHKYLRRALDAFVEIRPSLRYNALTLFTLLRTLSRTKIAGSESLRLLRKWRNRWGPLVEDSSVQWRIAKFSVREGRHDIALLMKERMLSNRHEASQATQPSSTNTAPHHDLTRQKKMWSIYPRSGQHRRRWNSLLRHKLTGHLGKQGPASL